MIKCKNDKILNMQWNSQLYNSKYSFVYEYGSEVIDLLAPEPGEMILDLGCGSGQLTGQIEAAGADVVGIDSSPEMIETAQSHFPGIDFRVMDAAELDFDFQFDAIFSNAAFHWIKYPEKAVAAMYRNLKDGGRIVMEFGGKGNVQSIYKVVKDLLAQRGYSFNDFWYFPSIGEFAGLLEKNGFEVNFAQHFARDTELAPGDDAIIDWIEMFGDNFFHEVTPSDRLQILNEAREILRPAHFKNGKWVADYKRIRIIATR